jgi:hypothetical protein
MSTFAFGITFEVLHCGACGVHFAVTEAFADERRRDGRTWHCPNGHARVFRETEAERLRKQLAAVEQAKARAEQNRDAERNRAERAERSVIAQRAQTTKARNALERERAKAKQKLLPAQAGPTATGSGQ